MKIVAVVPMKLNNQRLPQKNIKSFTNGEPLCTFILNSLLSIDEIDGVYVYCSNPDILGYLPEGVIFIKRKKELDTDATSMNEVLKCFANDIEADCYLMAHTTAPFIKKESLEKGINAVTAGNHDSAFSVIKMQDFLWKNNKPMNYSLESIPRTQDLSVIMKETSGFYIYKKEVINGLNRRIGNNPYFVEVSEIESIDIDEPEDFMIADAVYMYLKRKDSSQCEEISREGVILFDCFAALFKEVA